MLKVKRESALKPGVEMYDNEYYWAESYRLRNQGEDNPTCGGSGGGGSRGSSSGTNSRKKN